MKIFQNTDVLSQFFSLKENKQKTIGFVPTMGALHQGHLSLIEASKSDNEISVCSIFINPIQFNNKDDYEKYPVQHDRDIEMLGQAGCDVLFLPKTQEVYPETPTKKYDFGHLEKVMEDAFRPGHFNGVALVVERLFEMVKPHRAYFGEKDFQQLCIVRKLVEILGSPVEIKACPIIRESDGLAMSSRNIRLSEKGRALAPHIYCILKDAAENVRDMPYSEVINSALNEFKNIQGIDPEYFVIADENSLRPLNMAIEGKQPRIFTAAYIEDIRLIDNLKIIL